MSDPTTTAGSVDALAAALKEAVDLHGPALFYEREALRIFLEARDPGATRDIAALLIAVDQQVPQTLLGGRGDEQLRSLSRALEQQLKDSGVLNRYAAAWAIEAWSTALGLAGITHPVAVHVPAAVQVEVPQATADLEPAQPLPIDHAAQDAAPPPSPVEPREGSTAAPLKTRFSRLGSIVVVASTLAAAAALYFDDQPSRGTATRVAAGRTSTEPAERPPDAARPDPSTSTVDAAGSSSPVASPPVPPAPTVSSSAATVVPVVPVESMSRVATTPVITDVDSSEPLVGDGRLRELRIKLATPQDDIASVSSRFVSGDPAFATAPVVIAVSGDALREGRIPAGMIGLRSARAVTGSFEYVVTTTDGRRSAPFVKRLSATAGPTTPPSIVDLRAPAGILAGRPFVLTLDVEPGDHGIVAIERRSAVDDITASSEPVASVITRLSGLRGAGRQTVRYAMPAIAAAAPTSYDFALVDRDGIRGALRRVTFDVNPAPVPTPRTAAAACPQRSCGTVVSSRDTTQSTTEGPITQIERALGIHVGAREPGRRSYDVSVRLDDGAVRTLVAGQRWRIGARVRLMSGDRLVALGRDR